MTVEAATAGIAATMQDALALAEIFGPGTEIGINNPKSAILAPKSLVLTAAEAISSIRLGHARYHFAFAATPADQIAPLVDALTHATGTGFMPICLASPWEGRTVYQGHLFQAGRLLGNLARDFGAALDGGVGIIPHAIVAAGALAIRWQCAALKEQGQTLAIIDAIDEDDCAAIAEALASFPLIGGSPWASPRAHAAEPAAPDGPLAIISGALNRQAIFQIGAARAALPVWDVDFAAKTPAADALAWAAQHAGAPFIITSSVPPDRLSPNAPVAEILGQIAQGLVAAGTSRLIITGNDTASAIITALGLTTLTLGAAFGMLRWLHAPGLALCVKPGGAGPKNLFLAEFGPQIRLNAPAE